MSLYLILKYFHIIAVTITIGGMFARQLERGIAKKNEDVIVVASLTRAAMRIDRIPVIPWSNVILVFGVILALMQKWPILSFFKGASQNWLLVTNFLLILLLLTIFTEFVPYNRRMEPILQAAVSEGQINPPLSAMLNDQ